jgi:hypothetical protein
LRAEPRLRFAGQMTGCEGYVESASIGLIAGLYAAAEARTTTLAPPPATTALGSLLGHITGGHIETIEPGARSFQPAPPMRLSGTLANVAFGHAADMAKHGYFEHQDLQGRSPADRVRAIGYREKLVGENIAYGPKSAEEVVQGWLSSPGHCENIMDPRFAEMGIAYAPGQASKRGLYWVQLLADPLT